MKVIIVGGVAGGASCAARLRRLDERAEILMVERGPYVSFANCGLPYHVGGVIEHESDLLVANERVFREHFAVDCRTGCEAIGDLAGGQDRPAARRRERRGDDRVLRQARARPRARRRSVRRCPASTFRASSRCAPCPTRGRSASGSSGGRASSPGWGSTPGSRSPGRRMRAVVVGGGFIGLEMAENLTHRGFDVTVVEMADQVLAPLDPEYGAHRRGLPRAPRRPRRPRRRRRRLRAARRRLARGLDAVGRVVSGGHRDPRARRATRHDPRDAWPGSRSASSAGSASTTRCARATPTSSPSGDAVEVRDFVTGEWSLIALAGPANRQARIAADVIAGRDSHFRGTQGTAVVGLFGATVAWTGANEKTLDRLGDDDFEKIYIYPNSHAGYYPGAKPIAMKILFRQVRRTPARRPGGRRGRRRQADQRARAGDPAGRDRLRPRAGRALLRAAVRQREGPGQLRRHGRRRRPARRHAAQSTGTRPGRRLPARRARAVRARRRARSRRGQHPDGRAALAPRRAPP